MLNINDSENMKMMMINANVLANNSAFKHIFRNWEYFITYK